MTKNSAPERPHSNLREARISGLAARHVHLDLDDLLARASKVGSDQLSLDEAEAWASKLDLQPWVLIDALQVLHGPDVELPNGVSEQDAVALEEAGIRNYSSDGNGGIAIREVVLCRPQSEGEENSFQETILFHGHLSGQDFVVTYPSIYGSVHLDDLVDVVANTAALTTASVITGVTQPITESAASKIGVRPFFFDPFSGQFDCVVKVSGSDFGFSFDENSVARVVTVDGSEVHPGVISSATKYAYQVRNRLLYRPGTDFLYASMRNQDHKIFTDAQLSLTPDVEQDLAQQLSDATGYDVDYTGNTWVVRDPSVKAGRKFGLRDGKLDYAKPRGKNAVIITDTVVPILQEHLSVLAVRDEYLKTRQVFSIGG